MNELLGERWWVWRNQLINGWQRVWRTLPVNRPQIQSGKKAGPLKDIGPLEMAAVVTPLVVRESPHARASRALASDREVDAGATAAANSNNTRVLQLLKKLSAIAVAMLQKPGNHGQLINAQWAIYLDAR